MRAADRHPRRRSASPRPPGARPAVRLVLRAPHAHPAVRPPRTASARCGTHPSPRQEAPSASEGMRAGV
ncbi:MAG: hypothetical protein ACK56F_13040, partial [bacterium]